MTTPRNKKNRILLTTSQAIDRLGISERTFRRYRQPDGILHSLVPAAREGTASLYDERDIARMARIIDRVRAAEQKTRERIIRDREARNKSKTRTSL